jgi:hypothetical protein
MNEDVKSRVDTAIPKPEALDRLSEDEKRSLEIDGEVEHAHGMQREKLAEQAEDIVDGDNAHEQKR